MIGRKLSLVLVEIESALIEHEAYKAEKPEYTMEAFRAATRIFMSALLDKSFELQMSEKFDQNDAGNMANKLGEDLRKLIKTYTNIDTYKFYE